MCLMDFVSFLGCGHTEYVFPETGYCDFGFDAEKQSCSKGANELKSVKLGKSVPPLCPPCYEEQLTIIGTEHMEHYCKFVHEAGERGVSKVDLKDELDRVMKEVMKEVMKAAMESKTTCDKEGTRLPSLSRCAYPLQN